MKTHLGQEIRRLRLQARVPLRGLATRLDISPAHLSDIEHNRRRPSEQLLRKIASELCDVGASFESLELLVTGTDPTTREWLASTPGVRALLRTILESGRSPQEINLVLKNSFRQRKRAKAPIAPQRRVTAAKAPQRRVTAAKEVRARRQSAGGES